MPSVGSLVRARWSHLLEGSPRLSTALSPESIIDDLIVVGGPIAVAMFERRSIRPRDVVRALRRVG